MENSSIRDEASAFSYFHDDFSGARPLKLQKRLARVASPREGGGFVAAYKEEINLGEQLEDFLGNSLARLHPHIERNLFAA